MNNSLRLAMLASLGLALPSALVAAPMGDADMSTSSTTAKVKMEKKEKTSIKKKHGKTAKTQKKSETQKSVNDNNAPANP
jgi:hypothetical protein